MNERALELLYRSFDGDLTAEEREDLRNSLAVSEELRRERDRIEAVRRIVAAGAVESFRPFFAGRVMGRIVELRRSANGMVTLQEWLSRVFRRVVIGGAVVTVGLLIFNFVQSRGVSVAAAFGISDAPIEEMLELPLESILGGTS
jgi:hypothetical protein